MGWEAILEYGLLFSFAWVLLGLGQKNDLDGAELVVVLFGFPRCFSILGVRDTVASSGFLIPLITNRSEWANPNVKENLALFKRSTSRRK